MSSILSAIASPFKNILPGRTIQKDELEPLLEKVETSFKFLRESYRKDPQSLNPKMIRDLTEDINYIKGKYNSMQQGEKKKWWQYIDGSNILVSSLNGLAWLSATVISVVSYISSKDNDPANLCTHLNDLASINSSYSQMLNTTVIHNFCDDNTATNENALGIADMIVGVIGMLTTLVIAGAIQNYDSDRKIYRTRALIKSIENTRSLDFEKFLKALDEYLKSQNEEVEEQKKKLQYCISSLDSNLKEIAKKDVLPRDQLVVGLIGMLPDNHPIKQQFSDLREAAIKLLEKESSSAVESGSSKAQESLSIVTKEKIGESTSSSSSEELIKKSSFRGERMTFSQAKNPDPALLKKVGQKIKREYFLQQWKSLEENLGLKLDQLYIDGFCVDKSLHVKEFDDPENKPESVAINIGKETV